MIRSNREKARASAAKYAGRRKSMNVVTERFAKSGRCEACGTEVPTAERHHLVGRRHLIGRPWCDDPALVMALCSAKSYGFTREGCHERAHADEEFRRGLRLMGLLALCTAYKVDPPEWADTDPLGALRAVCGVLSGEAA